jgi:streptogramin lyase/predicted Ser/Thr protein kinase
LTFSADPRIGEELLGYRIERALGRGGMSVVYLAEDLRLERRVALKFLAPRLAEDPAFRARFLYESQVAASLDHPNVVPIYAAGEDGDELYIAMRYVEGSDLKELLHEGPLDGQRAVRICAQVAAALDFAHARRLVHRDVKPSNVLLDAAEHVYLADFGLTKRTDGTQPLEPGLFGTIDYVAPEQIRGDDVDGSTDVYALACLLYECLSGSAPFRRATDAATLYAHLEEAPPTLPGLEQVLPKALAKDPADRYSTCRELVDDARRALGISVAQRSRLPLAMALSALALIAAVLLATHLTGRSSPPAAAGRLLRIDAGSNRVTSSHTVGDGPVAVAAGSGRVWVASYRDGTLWQFDPASGETARVPAVGRPFDVTVHDGYAYVAASGPDAFAGNVTRFDAVGAEHTGGIALLACSLTSGAYGIWVAGCPNVERLRVSPNEVARDAEVPIPYPRSLSAGNYREALAGMATGEGGIWVVGDADDRRLWRIDPRTRRIVATIALGFPPAKVAIGGGGIWITDQLRDRVVELDARTYRVLRSVSVARGPVGVTVAGGSVWIAGAIEHAVTRVDTRTGRVVATIPVAASPQAVAVGDGSVWVVGDAR